MRSTVPMSRIDGPMIEKRSSRRHPRRNLPGLVAGVLAAVVAASTLAGCAAAPSPAATPASAHSPEVTSTRHVLAVNGHTLAFHVTPGRLPAIVLDAGGGLDSSYWKKIVPKLAERTGSEIITYDRAGEGASQEVPGPWKAQNAAADLHEGLRQLGVTHDVILVSHSLAGEIATHFVNAYPHVAVGAVLVDANLPQFFTDAETARIAAANQQQIEELKSKPSTRQTRQLLAEADDYGPVHQAYHRMTWPSSVPATAIVSSQTPFDTSDDARLWRKSQAEFVAAAPNRRLVTAAHSSHDIPIDRPGVVIDAIADQADHDR